jgi:hypothetical protein
MIRTAPSWRKRLRNGVLGLFAVLVLGGVIAWRVFRVGDLTLIGTGYAAQQTCACMFVSGRTLDSCMTDLEPLARKLITVHPGDHEVTATAHGLATATARWEKGFGCSLQ